MVLSIGLAGAFAGCGSSASASRDARSTPSPAASAPPRRTGPFAVGRRTITFVDRSRKTPANGTQPAQSSRTLRTIVEYPAAGKPDANRELLDAPALGGKYPIVVFVHGFGAHADTPYLHPVAAAGYIAVAPAFPLTNADTPGGPNRADVVNEPADVSFVLTQFGKLPTRHADLQAAANRSAVGIMGQSVGAAVALSVGFNKQYKDARFKAVVSSANSCLPPNCPYNSAPVPLLVMHGTADPFAPYQPDLKSYTRAPKPKFFLTLIGAKHIQFGAPLDPIAERVTIDFLRRYLRGDASAVTALERDATVPGKATVKAST